MKRTKRRSLRRLWIAALLMVLLLTLQPVFSQENKGLRTVTQEEYDRLQRYAQLDAVYQTLMDRYYIEPNSDDLLLGAIDGMIYMLDDPYTYYYTPEEMAISDETDAGLYHGVGIYVGLDAEGYPCVLQVYEGSFAAVAGLKMGDRIVRVDDLRFVLGDASLLDAVTDAILGEDGTTVEIEVLRGEETLTFTVERGEVEVKYARWTLLEGNLGYLRIDEFNDNAVPLTKKAIRSFKDAGVTGLVLDLRGNPGGYLDVVLDIADLLLPEGIAVYMEDRFGHREEYSVDGSYWDVPMVVLVDSDSASASELFTGAFMDAGRGTVIGTKTFGKGIVQSIKYLPGGAGLSYTTQTYFTPKGNAIHKIGLTPDVVLEWDGIYASWRDKPDPERDNQLAAAIQYLKEEK